MLFQNVLTNDPKLINFMHSVRLPLTKFASMTQNDNSLPYTTPDRKHLLPALAVRRFGFTLNPDMKPRCGRRGLGWEGSSQITSRKAR